jgi:mannose-6-phosphate isomerase-like protein (cupin superfamily)
MTNPPSAPAQPASERYSRTGPGEGEAYWFYGDLAIIRSPEGSMPIVIEHRVTSGGAAPLHLHRVLEDNFYLLSGRLALRCGEDEFVARSGDYVVLPRAVPHTLRVIGAEDAVMLHTHADPRSSTSSARSEFRPPSPVRSSLRWTFPR